MSDSDSASDQGNWDDEAVRSYVYYCALKKADDSALKEKRRLKRRKIVAQRRAWQEWPFDAPVAVPEHPLRNIWTERIELWRKAAEFPVRWTESLDLLIEIVPLCDRPDKSTRERAKAVLDSGGSVDEVLDVLGDDGQSALLGLRHTAGTALGALPPCARTCWRAFNERHAPKKSELTVGARALAKHGIRASDGAFAQALHAAAIRGKKTEAEQNVAAVKALAALFESAVWLNLHGLPHNVVVYEIRDADGYGARWHVNAKEEVVFRGFVEPPMVDGHAKSWHH